MFESKGESRSIGYLISEEAKQIVKNRPRKKEFPSILFGFVFAAMGLVVIVLGGQTNTLVCHRIESNRIDCQLESD